VVFAGSWNAVDANTRGPNFKELGTHPDPSCLFTVAQQLVQNLTAKNTNLFRLVVKPSKRNPNPWQKSCDEEGLKVFRVDD
jgi:hypothetical protein